LLYFKKILKTKIKENSITLEEISYVISSLIEIIFESRFNDICLNNITVLFQVFLNHPLIASNGILLIQKHILKLNRFSFLILYLFRKFTFFKLGKFVSEIISKINTYNDSNGTILTYKPLIGLYDKIMNSNAVYSKNYQSILEKIFANVEYILQKLLEAIVSLDASNNFDELLLW